MKRLPLPRCSPIRPHNLERPLHHVLRPSRRRRRSSRKGPSLHQGCVSDPLSSPAVHIQWQNSQSACAAMEELRAASSMPRHLSNPLQHQNHLRSISSSPHLLPGHHLPPPPPLPPHLTPSSPLGRVRRSPCAPVAFRIDVNM